MRSLSTKPAFQSAYDSLVGIFANTSRKVRSAFTFLPYLEEWCFFQAEKLENAERLARNKKAAEAARKLKKAEQKLRKKQSRQRKQSRGREAGPGRGTSVQGRGTSVQEFLSGKREIWIMPGAEQEKTKPPQEPPLDSPAEDLGGKDTPPLSLPSQVVSVLDVEGGGGGVS